MTVRCCTRMPIEPVVVDGEVDQHTEMAAKMNRRQMVITTTVKDPPREGGVTVAPRVDKVGRFIGGSGARKSKEKMSVRRCRLIQKELSSMLAPST